MSRRRLHIGVCLVVVFLLTNVTCLSLRLIPVLTKGTIDTNEKYIRASATINRHGSLHNYTLNLEMDVLTTLYEMRMNVGYYVRIRSSENWIYNKTLNFCAFLERPSIDRISSLVYEALKLHGKMPLRCPIAPARYKFHNVTLKQVKFPSFIPETNFGFTVNCALGPKYELILRSHWYGQMRRMMV